MASLILHCTRCGAERLRSIMDGFPDYEPLRSDAGRPVFGYVCPACVARIQGRAEHASIDILGGSVDETQISTTTTEAAGLPESKADTSTGTRHSD